MAAKAASIWVCAKTPYSHQGVSDLSSNHSELALNSNFRKWECSCLAVASAQRAITPVEDEKPSLTCAAESSGAMERIEDIKSREFHKDLNLLPKPLTANNFSPRDGSKVRVAYQGLPGAYSEAAAVKAYPKCETVPCDQFEAAFKAVELWLVDKAVLPIENSVGGSIHRNYDLLLHHRLHIVGEVQLQVNHCLLGLPGVRKEELKRVLSHYQAFAQCEMTLSSLGIIRINTDDSALAAQMVASTGLRDTGAVASARAANIYGLDILAEKLQRVFSVPGTRPGTPSVITQLVGSLKKEYPTNGIMTQSTGHTEKFLLSMTVNGRVSASYSFQALRRVPQDDDDNITRFLILGREPIIPGTDRPYKTSVVFTLEEGPGVLFKALAVFALRGINLTKIESRPQKQRPLRIVDDSNEGSAKYFDYLFYIDFEASMADPRAQNALEHLKEFARFLRVLGCYQKDTIP